MPSLDRSVCWKLVHTRKIGRNTSLARKILSQSGKADRHAAFGALLGRLFHDDLNVAAQTRQALEQAALGDAPKLPAEQS